MSETVYVVHDYLRRIDKEMTCDKKKKKQFLQRLQNDMEDFADSATTTLTENDLEKHFGTPQSIAENFLSTEPYNEVKRTFKHRKAVRVFVIATVVFALVCVLGYILFDNWRERQFEDGYIVTRLYEEVEGTPPPEPEGTRVYGVRSNTGSCTNGKIIYKKIHLLHGKQYSGFCSLVDW